jgi:2Fe-2S ferredoxin
MAPKLTFLPMNHTFEVKAGESILDAAITHDVPMQHACGGFCACTTCHVKVKAGMENLSQMEEDEQDRLEVAADNMTETSRLGCQAKVHGDVTVEIINLDI